MNCITIQHCIVRQWTGEKAVSRYNYCIVTEVKRGRWAQAEQALGAQGARGARRRTCVGARVDAAGSWARGRGAQQVRGRSEHAAAGAPGERQAGRRRGARGRQALGERSERGLDARACFGLCTRCTRPVFDPD